MQGGRYAAAALVDRAVEEATGLLRRRPLVVLTGGGAAQIRSLLDSQSIGVPDLVLRGLAVLAQLYQVLLGALPLGLTAGVQVDAAVAAMGLSPAQLTANQRSLLASPFNLVLVSAIADEPEALSFTSDNGLLASYWDRKRRDCAGRRRPPPRFAAKQTLTRPCAASAIPGTWKPPPGTSSPRR